MRLVYVWKCARDKRHQAAAAETAAEGAAEGAAAGASGAAKVSRRDSGAKRLRPPPGEDFWIFGYGSLMWHPGFPHLEVRPALLHGYHRHFCIYSHIYRGTRAWNTCTSARW
jgi:hypothetical protein